MWSGDRNLSSIPSIMELLSKRIILTHLECNLPQNLAIKQPFNEKGLKFQGFKNITINFGLKVSVTFLMRGLNKGRLLQ